MNRRRNTVLLTASLSLVASAMAFALPDRVTTFTYDANGLLLTENGSRTNVVDTTTYEYTTAGYVKKITDAEGLVRSFAGHDARGLPSSYTDANGIVTNLTYTNRGWLKTSSQMVDYGFGGPVTLTTTFEYNEIGIVTRVILPDGSFHTLIYDNARRLTAIQNNLTERLEYVRDVDNNVTTFGVRNSSGAITQAHHWSYDELGRVLKDIGKNGQFTDFDYDTNNNETSRTDALTHATARAYDALDRVTKVTDADSEEVDVTYDDNDRIKTVTDQRDFVTTYNYNDFGDLTSIVSPDTGTTTFEHDNAGNVKKKTDSRGVISNYTYDALNRIRTISYPSDSTRDIEYIYDNLGYCGRCNGRLAKISDNSGDTYFFYDDAGRIFQRVNHVTIPGGSTTPLTTLFDYDHAGRLTKTTYPNGHIVDLVRDSIGQIVGVNSKEDASAPSETLANFVSYEPYGPVKGMAHGNSLVLLRDYDLDGRLESQTLSGMQDLDYGYDNANNITSITNTQDASDNQAFLYDSLYRLTDATGRYGDIDYDYDAVGNRTERIMVLNGDTTTETYTYKTTNNRLSTVGVDVNGGGTNTRAYQYDAAGNITEEHRVDNTKMKPVYDATNRMKSVSQ